MTNNADKLPKKNLLSLQIDVSKFEKASDEEKAAIQAQIDANMAEVKANDERLAELERLEGEYAEKIRHLMLNIPNIIDPSVPIGPDDSANVEVQRFGEPAVPAFEIPYHTETMEPVSMPAIIGPT